MGLNTFGWTPSEVLQSPTGDVVVGASLTVFTDITKETPVTALYGKDGSVLAGSAVVSDNKGRFGFKAADTYSLLYVWDGSTADPWPVAAHEALDQGMASHAQAVTAAEAARDDALAAVADAQTAATNAQAAANLVGAPADTAIAAAVNGTSSQTRGALNSAYADLDSLPEVLAIKNGVKADTTTGLDGTSDSAAINSLITSLSALGGGRIKLPAGKIRLDTAIVPKNGVVIEGAGTGRTVLLPKMHAFDYSGGSTSAPLTGAHFRDFTIDGTNRTSTYKGYHGQYHLRCSWVNLYVKNTGMTGLGPDFLRECLIQNVTTENTGLDNTGAQPSGNGIGVGCGGWTDRESFTIVGCTAINAKRFGIMVEGSNTATGAKIIGNTATACGDAGFGIGAGLGMIVEGNHAYANVDNGFELSNLTLASANPAGQAIVRGNFASKNGGHGIAYDATVHRPDSGYCQIVGNTCAENTKAGISVAIDLSLVTSVQQIAGFKIEGNLLHKNGITGLSIATQGVSGSGFTLTGWTIDNNTISETTGDATTKVGFRLAASLTGSSIRGNMFYHHLVSAAYSGIYVGVGGAAITLAGCRIENNTSASANKVLVVDAAATVDAATVIAGNQPDAGSGTPKTVTSNYTAASTDTTVIANIATAGTVYLPEPTTVSAGKTYKVKNINAASLNVRTAAGALIDGASPKVLAQWATVTAMSDGTQWLTV